MRAPQGHVGRRLSRATFLAGIVLLGCLAGAANAAAPAAITGPVTSVGPTSATAGGTVNPGGQATGWYIEYGTSTGHGSKTPTENARAAPAELAGFPHMRPPRPRE